MASLLLLRHGQILANRKGLWHGSTDSPLTWRGKRQAERTARHIQQQLEQQQLTLAAIYTSPLERCVHTAQRVAERLNMEAEVIGDLAEYAIGEWEGMPFKHLAATHDFVTRATEDPQFAPPGGESINTVAARIVRAIESIHHSHLDDEQVLIVGHGAALAVALGSLIDGDPTRWVEYHFANCSLTELVLSPAPYVNFFNSTHHL